MQLHTRASILLDQLDHIVRQLSASDLGEEMDVLSGSSLGQHVRHTLEFFICLIDGRNDGIINYDQRKHDQDIERDPEMALHVITSIRNFLAESSQDFPLIFSAGYNLETDEQVKMNSSFYRELAYNIEHAIHHMALIRIGLRSLKKDIFLPDHFGVASSTVRYQRREG